jgi:exodeoxyribonuclease VII large subunit
MPADFFEFREKLGAARVPKRADAAAGDALSVSQLTNLIDKAIRTELPSTVMVRGEVSNLNLHRTSGHLYFTLKDAGACIDCAMWKSDLTRLKFQPIDGMELLASGRVGVYQQRGKYQLYVSTLKPVGKGALELAFQQLRAKLEVEGLFAPQRKKALPVYPLNISIVTSRQTAALQDVLKVFARYRFLRLSVFHVPVQGDGSAEKIADAINQLGATRRFDHGRPAPCDVILLARGGGSLEDLWEFNEELVARAIARCGIPLVTGLGHETDVSIADLVADYHAHTPTEAAQVIANGWRTVESRIESLQARLRREMRAKVLDARHMLAGVERHDIFRRPAERIYRARLRLDDTQRALSLAAMRRVRQAHARLAPIGSLMVKCHPVNDIRRRKDRLDAIGRELVRGMHETRRSFNAKVDSLQRTLEALDPRQVLARGYSITRLKRGSKLLHSAADAHPGDVLETRLVDGTVESVVQDQRQGRLFDA